MQQVTQDSYDQIPYPSVALRQTHPDSVAAVATLFGMRPADTSACRVLEIGCADATNLIPMACDLPGSEFVGIDLSALHIERGQQAARDLGLRNLALRQANIMDVDVAAELGHFDYIIVYGVYSWVPPAVQDKILDVCGSALNAQGVAFVSYNTYPGWHMRGAVRDMLLYHTRDFTDLQQRIDQARAILRFLAESTPAIVNRLPENKAYGLVLESEHERMLKQSDSYMLHEMLEECNDPLYFYQFAERAGRHGLQYLSEIEVSTMLPNGFPQQVADTVGRIGTSVIATEQYLDFLRNRMFRQTLLCRQDACLDRTLNSERLYNYHVASPMLPLSPQTSVRSDANEKFRSPKGSVVSSTSPLNKAAMLRLSESWPLPIRFEQLLAETREIAGSTASAGDDAQTLGDMLLRAYLIDLVEIQLNAPRFVTGVSERPCSSPFARRQARLIGQVANQRHENFELDQVGRQLFPLLDGQHDRAALIGAAMSWGEGAPADETTAAGVVDEKLREYARAALLVA
jgi:methyltransferase-like protein